MTEAILKGSSPGHTSNRSSSSSRNSSRKLWSPATPVVHIATLCSRIIPPPPLPPLPARHASYVLNVSPRPRPTTTISATALFSPFLTAFAQRSYTIHDNCPLAKSFASSSSHSCYYYIRCTRHDSSWNTPRFLPAYYKYFLLYKYLFIIIIFIIR